jgi:Ca2+-binding RTX toxin-like protein
MPRLAIGCATALALTACAPAPALAARVTHVPGAAVLAYAAEPGEAGRVVVAGQGDAVVVTDAGPATLTAGGDCALVAAGTVACPAESIGRVELAGSDLGDVLTNASTLPARADGGGGPDVIRGGPGPDTLLGGPGDDQLQGADGDDTLGGGPGSDQIVGGPGRDAVLYVSAWSVSVDLSAGAGGNPLFGDRDRLVQFEDVAGGAQQGTITGTGAQNDLSGGGGADYVDGLRGADRLEGGDGPDVVAARDGGDGEPVSCGPGDDFAIVDRGDRIVRRGPDRCERVDDGRRAAPRAGRVRVQPRGCARTGSDAQVGLPAMGRAVPLRYSVGLSTGYAGRSAPWLAAARCSVRLTASPGRGRRPASVDLSGDAATGSQAGRRAITTTLTVGRPACAAGAVARAGTAPGRRLRVRSRRRPGDWRVRGRFSVAAAEGTDWTTVEGCADTTTIVRSGRVRVFDRARGRTVVVRAGQSYRARSRR